MSRAHESVCGESDKIKDSLNAKHISFSFYPVLSSSKDHNTNKEKVSDCVDDGVLTYT